MYLQDPPTRMSDPSDWNPDFRPERVFIGPSNLHHYGTSIRLPDARDEKLFTADGRNA